MKEDYALNIRNLSKSYSIDDRQFSQAKTITDSLKIILHRFFHRNSGKQTFWALNDINFIIKKGEVVGLIGKNGAGKSTLLKILARIIRPSAGEFEFRGRIASLLEVGTGFHPELTGRENIFFSGSILGMSRQEISRKFNDIVSFSGVEKFLETPVKRYSSGMTVRLAFSVAVHLDTDILLIDEVLSVGDASFQEKSLSKMKELTSNENKTVVFVSHNMNAVQTLCNRCILLENGCIIDDAKPHTVVNKYLKRVNYISTLKLSKRIDRRGSGNVKLLDFSLLGPNGDQSIHTFEKLYINLFFSKNLMNYSTCQIAIGVWSETNISLFRFESELIKIRDIKSTIFKIKTGRININPMRCYVNVLIHVDGELSDHIEHVKVFDVLPSVTIHHKQFEPHSAVMIIDGSIIF